MPPSTDKPAVDLSTPVQFLKGGGAHRAEQLARLGVTTVRDLLFNFPRDYQDLTDVRTIAALEEGPLVSVLGTVEEVDMRDGGGRSIVGVLVRQGDDHLRAVWFNQPFMREKFRRGQTVLLSGRARQRSTRWEMAHPHVKWIETEQDEPRGSLLPIYPLTEGLAQRHVGQLVRAALEACLDQLEEVFPAGYLEHHDLWPLRFALPQIHFPDSPEDLERARRRFVYQELLVLQLALALKRQQVQSSLEAHPLELSAKIDARIRRLFPFPLTAGQNQAVAEIAADMGRAYPMNRLLQGDVGSGKTIVAVYAMLLAVAHQTQVALMAPTEVLARQHLDTLDKLLAGSNTRLGLLAGGQSAKTREETLAGIAAGEIQIVIGTQAVIAAGVDFARLGLVVIDEQHKFGVRQRAALKHSAVHPHYLVMTATPIPRTVSMTLFGDLDVTTLIDSPPGRQNVHTYFPPAADRPRWWEFFRKKLREGRQAFVIVPLVARGSVADALQEETEPEEALAEPPSPAPATLFDEDVPAETAPPPVSLEEAYEHLANGELEAFRLGLIHGRMSSSEKQAAMDDFRAGRTQVLVATSVVEVGVDVPNATLMTIESAERFGLAQLHQLRGRISRGMHPGYCCVFTGVENDEARARLAAFVESSDGFRLSEVDFELRGPGDVLGTRQHGLPPLRVANLTRDAATLEEARRDAREMVEADPGLTSEEHALLRRMALVRYGKSLDLGDVG
ncbi:MAG: ATP-dependent DNA helicase RecG [Planctomycetota bacterium]|nr:MAG: ATP-dependent DNA helicase RecG [Planctomycetota bacterium]